MKVKLVSKILLILSAWTLIQALPALTYAQASSSAQQDELGSIIVTARRVEERLQDVPISISVFSPKIARVALGISSILFLGINLLAIVHHDLRRFAETVRLFCSVDGFLLGMSIPLTVLLWLTYKKSRDGSRVSSMM